MTEAQPPKFSGIVSKLGLSPMEAPQMVANKEQRLFIGVPKERAFQEHRVSLTPEAVGVLVSNGHRILVESTAGQDCSYSDNDYSEAGAEITKDVEQVFQADILLKVAPPTISEIKMLKTNQTLISPIHLPTLKKDYVKNLMERKVTAFAFEYLQDSSGSFPFVRSMSEIAGSSIVLIAAEYLSNISHGVGILLGGVAGIPPAKVVILGAGVVGTYAAKAALGLGATVKVFDDNVYKLMNLQNNLGTRVFTSVLTPQVLENELHTADVAIGAIHSKQGRTPIVVSEEMVSNMKKGAVVIDVSIDQGGCFETSEVTNHDKPTFIKHDVIHYCVPNIPSRVSRTASQSVSNNLVPILLRCNELGGIKNLLYEDSGIRNGTYLYKGSLTNQHLSQKFNIRMRNLELLFAADL